MHKFEQIAMKTGNIERRIQDLGSVYDHGPVTRMKNDTEWVRDTVRAVHVYLHRQYFESSMVGSEFAVQLAFNYELIPTRELELIQLAFGETVQMKRGEETGLAHLGYHIPDDKSLAQEIEWWNNRGFTCAQVSMTTSHTGTKRRYLYAFIDTVREIGAYTKVISRRPDTSAKREMADYISEFEHVNQLTR